MNEELEKIFKSNLSEKQKDIIEKIKKEFPSINLYLVGGFVRNFFLSKQKNKKLSFDFKDLDFEIYNIEPSDFEEFLSKNDIKSDVIGKSFGVYKAENMDFSFPRQEKKIGLKHNDYEIVINPYMSIEEASLRRDFTMNALMFDVINLSVIDIYGGISDINKNIIKMVNEKTFKEDELRGYRMVQFASRFSMSIEEKTLSTVKEFNYNDIFKERKIEELKKIIKNNFNYSEFFNNMMESNILKNEFKNFFDIVSKNEKKIKSNMVIFEFSEKEQKKNNETSKYSFIKKEYSPLFLFFLIIIESIDWKEKSELILFAEQIQNRFGDFLPNANNKTNLLIELYELLHEWIKIEDNFKKEKNKNTYGFYHLYLKNKFFNIQLLNIYEVIKKTEINSLDNFINGTKNNPLQTTLVVFNDVKNKLNLSNDNWNEIKNEVDSLFLKYEAKEGINNKEDILKKIKAHQ